MMETISDPAVAFDNDEPAHRDALIKTLRARGLDAYEYNSGGNTMHVCVDLVNGEMDSEELLQVATGSADSLCDVGLMGYSATGQAGSREWARTPTLDEAIAAFGRYVADRDEWVARLRRSALDL